MEHELYAIWVYLQASPLAALTLTLVAYQAAYWLYERSGQNPLVNPVLIAVLALVAIILASGLTYREYFDGAQFVHFMLGPATVALAIPLYKQLTRLKGSVLALATALIAGPLTAITTAYGFAALLGGSDATIASLLAKSVTTPIAMALSEALGGLPALTSVCVILTGIIGAVGATFVLDLVRVRDRRARGVAVGIAAHGIGTARAFQVGEINGAFAGLAMGLNAFATSLMLPLLYALFAG